MNLFPKFSEYVSINEAKKFSLKDFDAIRDYIIKNVVGDQIALFNITDEEMKFKSDNEFVTYGKKCNITQKGQNIKNGGSIYTLYITYDTKSISVDLYDMYTTSKYLGNLNSTERLAGPKDYKKTKNKVALSKSFDDGNIAKVYKAIDGYIKKRRENYIK